MKRETKSNRAPVAVIGVDICRRPQNG